KFFGAFGLFQSNLALLDTAPYASQDPIIARNDGPRQPIFPNRPMSQPSPQVRPWKQPGWQNLHKFLARAQNSDFFDPRRELRANGKAQFYCLSSILCMML